MAITGGASSQVERDARVFIAGHRGLVGSALVRSLQAKGFAHLITRTHAQLDLCDPAATDAFFAAEQPEYVFLAAARVGGIWANQHYPADFMTANLAIATSIIPPAYRWGATRLIFFGSTCAYPRECPQPMAEEYLFTGPVEPTSEAYAVSKIAGMKLCEAFNAQYGTEFITTIPATLYGPNDNFDLRSSHVLSALIRRFHEAKVRGEPAVEVWGTGTPLREFLYVDDLAEACLLLAELDSPALAELFGSPALRMNIGSSAEVSIEELACLVRAVVGFRGGIIFDRTKPDGTPRKLLDSGRIGRTGWKPAVSLEEGIRKTYEWYLASQGAAPAANGLMLRS